jgi:hypothetical protein
MKRLSLQNDSGFYLSADHIKPLVDIPGFCIATNRITIEGNSVRFMYRAKPLNENDSGWCFFSGVNEDEEYVNNPANSKVFAVNTIANYDQSIIPYLNAAIGSVFEKEPNSEDWQAVTDFEIP